MFLCWTKYSYDVVESPVSDFEIDDMTFEVCGKKRGKKQIEIAQKEYRQMFIDCTISTLLESGDFDYRLRHVRVVHTGCKGFCLNALRGKKDGRSGMAGERPYNIYSLCKTVNGSGRKPLI